MNNQLKNSPHIGIIGCGHMGSAMLEGLLFARYDPGCLHVLERSESVLQTWKAQSIQVYHEQQLETLVRAVDVLILTVRPGQHGPIVELLINMAETEGVVLPIGISCLAGVDLELFSQIPGQTWLRMMPNLPVAYGAGVLGMYAPLTVSAEIKESLSKILSSLGTLFWLEDEALLHVLTAVSGSGPALMWTYFQAMIEEAVQHGFDHDQARLLVLQTAFGAAKMGLEQAGDLNEWCTQVASRGGTTEQGLAVLKQRAFKETTVEAITAAIKRSKEIAQMK